MRLTAGTASALWSRCSKLSGRACAGAARRSVEIASLVFAAGSARVGTVIRSPCSAPIASTAARPGAPSGTRGVTLLRGKTGLLGHRDLPEQCALLSGEDFRQRGGAALAQAVVAQRDPLPEGLRIR